MKATRSFPILLVSTFVACWSAALSAQVQSVDFYNPFFSGGLISSNSVYRPLIYTPRINLFNADTGELRIGSVLAAGGDVNGQQINNVILELADDGRFDLKSFDETVIPPENIVMSFTIMPVKRCDNIALQGTCKLDANFSIFL